MQQLIACTDVDYRALDAVAACVTFAQWTDARPAGEHTARVAPVAPYVPGRFFERELPCLRAVLARVAAPLACVVVDGYVWLGGHGEKGLGAHLYDALGASVPVIGVAKTAFRGSGFAASVVRGGSARPLFVTAVGVDTAQAVGWVASMHGAHRFPTLLARVDRLCRDA